MLNLAVQLYTLRKVMSAETFISVLERVREIGYDGVEFVGFYGVEAAELRREMERIGLIAVSSHVPLADLRDKPREVFRYHRELGCGMIAFSYSHYQSRTDFEEMSRFMADTAKAAAEYGLKLGYHNHALEFESVFDGMTGMDIVLSHDLAVCFEPDIYWISKAGFDPVEYIEKYSGRCPAVHIKDGDRDYNFTEAGRGILNIPKIVRTALSGGTEWFIVEQDTTTIDPLESVSISLKYMRGIH